MKITRADIERSQIHALTPYQEHLVSRLPSEDITSENIDRLGIDWLAISLLDDLRFDEYEARTQDCREIFWEKRLKFSLDNVGPWSDAQWKIIGALCDAHRTALAEIFCEVAEGGGWRTGLSIRRIWTDSHWGDVSEANGGFLPNE